MLAPTHDEVVDKDVIPTGLIGAIGELKDLYDGFGWESHVWSQHGNRRSPYRVLILFGLSARTKDSRLVQMCRAFFTLFPSSQALVAAEPVQKQKLPEIVRGGQLPFVDSAVRAIRESEGAALRDPEKLIKIWGVGEKIVECVKAYGWGEQALPLDGNACRVVHRIAGFATDGASRNVAGLRRDLKELYRSHCRRLARMGVAMIDIHEILRLHGQVVCGKTPQCDSCPVSQCRSRRRGYVGPTGPPVTDTFWQDWRDLLLEPTCRDSTPCCGETGITRTEQTKIDIAGEENEPFRV